MTALAAQTRAVDRRPSNNSHGFPFPCEEFAFLIRCEESVHAGDRSAPRDADGHWQAQGGRAAAAAAKARRDAEAEAKAEAEKQRRREQWQQCTGGHTGPAYGPYTGNTPYTGTVDFYGPRIEPRPSVRGPYGGPYTAPV